MLDIQYVWLCVLCDFSLTKKPRYITFALPTHTYGLHTYTDTYTHIHAGLSDEQFGVLQEMREEGRRVFRKHFSIFRYVCLDENILRTYIHTHIHTYIHTYTLSLSLSLTHTHK